MRSDEVVEVVMLVLGRLRGTMDGLLVVVVGIGGVGDFAIEGLGD